MNSPKLTIEYCNVIIMHFQIECHYDSVTFHDQICDDNLFIIEDKSPEYTGFQQHTFRGVVTRHTDGSYTWKKKEY